MFALQISLHQGLKVGLEGLLDGLLVHGAALGRIKEPGIHVAIVAAQNGVEHAVMEVEAIAYGYRIGTELFQRNLQALLQGPQIGIGEVDEL